MNNKILFGIVGVLLAVAVLAAGAYFYLSAQRGEEAGPSGLPNVNLPPLSSSTAPQGATLPIATPTGEVQVRNFYPEARSINSHGDVFIRDQAEYAVIYYPQDTAFSLVIGAAPFEDNRRKAEEAFLAATGLSREDACRLNVFEAVPREVDESLAGKILGLSFCSR